MSKTAATAAACVAAVIGAGAPSPADADAAAASSDFKLFSTVILPKNAVSKGNTATIPFNNAAATTLRGGASAQEDDAEKKADKKKKKKRKNQKSPKASKNGTQNGSSKKESKATTDATTAAEEPATPSYTKESTTFSKKNTAGSSDPDKAAAPPKPFSHQDRIVKEILQQSDYYAILGVSRSATSAEIQKAYRRRCVLTHPDKMSCGDRKAFDKVAQAYEVLSDDHKRTVYNQHGKAGLEQQNLGRFPGGTSFQQDLFRSFFGMNRPSAAAPPRKNRTVRYQLDVTLEDLYQGLTRTVVVTQPGAGRNKKEVEVHVPRGMASGESITLAGEADAFPDAAPADLIFFLQQRPHKMFTRKGHDLAMEVDISLQQAICGFQHSFQHLDGRVVNILSARHKDDEPIVIQTGDVQVLKGQGMPKRAENTSGGEFSSEYGDLYVQYNVKMPSASASSDKLSVEERHELGRLLAKLEGVEEPSRDEETDSRGENFKVLERASASDFGRASGPYRTAPEHDPHLHYEEEHDVRPNFPFGSRQFHYYSSGNPFFGSRGFGDYTDEDEDGNVQCQQM